MELLADFVLVSGFAVTSVILFMLAVSKNRKTPQNILMLFLSVILLIIITVSASIHDLRWVFIITNLFEDGARFVLGPLLYIYIKSIFVRDKSPIKNHVFHFLPFLVYWLIISLPIFISRLHGAVIFDYLTLLNGNTFFAFVKDIFLLIYVFLSAKMFFVFKRKTKLNYSSFKETHFGWLKKFLISYFLVVLFDLVAISFRTIFKPDFSYDIGLLSLCFLILVTVYLGYQGLKQATSYLPRFLVENEFEEKVSSSQTLKLLPEEELNLLKSKLNDVLTQEKPYLEQEITLSSLAKRIGTTDKKLSVILNHSLNISFYDFINRYRVEEVKEKLTLEEYDKYSLLGIAYSCGFNSKSSFYRAFKKETGISPTDYKKKQTSEKSPTISNETLI
ncbi:MAG: helix-turn-helix domain-containing protein [Maribacter sp.]